MGRAPMGYAIVVAKQKMVLREWEPDPENVKLKAYVSTQKDCIEDSGAQIFHHGCIHEDPNMEYPTGRPSFVSIFKRLLN